MFSRSTWDFAGQKEYYATHQYFLSKRSLYLVLWRITDGVKGIDEIFNWLVNIQVHQFAFTILLVVFLSYIFVFIGKSAEFSCTYYRNAFRFNQR